jgi:hypothetical protein
VTAVTNSTPSTARSGSFGYCLNIGLAGLSVIHKYISVHAEPVNAYSTPLIIPTATPSTSGPLLSLLVSKLAAIPSELNKDRQPQQSIVPVHHRYQSQLSVSIPNKDKELVFYQFSITVKITAGIG